MLPLKLALANLKKKNNSCVSFVILVMIAVMLLEAGIVLISYAPGYYEVSNERLKEPHYIIRIHDNSYENRYLNLMKADSRVSEAAAVDCALMDNADYKTQSGKMIVYTNFLNADVDQEFFPLVPLYEDKTIDAREAIYVPLSFHLQGYETGDKVSFEFKRNQYEYRIAGFFETTWFGTSSTNLYNFYLRQEAYDDLYQQIGGGKILAARLHEPGDVMAFSEEFKAAAGIETDAYSRNASTIDNTFYNMRDISMALLNMMSAMAILISAVILGIACMVMWFGIANQVQDNMKMIGVQKALGCTTGQIRLSIVLEYMISGILGAVLGILMSYGLLGLLGTMISGMLGVAWKTPWVVGINIAGAAAVVAVAVGIAYCVSGKIKTLTPVTALMEGTGSHTFRSDRFKLSEGNIGDMALQLRLAGKHVFHAPRQYITLAVILVCVSFVLSFSVILYQGLVTDPNGFVRLMGSEISPLTVTLAPHTDYEATREDLEQMEGVDGTSMFESFSVETEGLSVTGYVSDDFGSLRSYSVYAGTMPVYDNEVVVTGILAKSLGKKIGDSLTITYNGVPGVYVICGLNQSLNNFGQQCAMTVDGIKRLNPSVKFLTVNVYLEEGWDYDRFLAAAEQRFKILDMAGEDKNAAGQTELDELKRMAEQRIADLLTMYGVDNAQYALMENGEIILSGDSSEFSIQSIEDTLTLVMTSAGVYASMIQLLTIFLTLLSSGVTAFILHYMVKSSVVRRKREFGIYKAMGYTSSQLMIQTALCYLPISVIGILVGTVAGGLLTNSIMSMLTSSIGISEIGFAVPGVSLAVLGAVVLMFVFLVAWLSARQIKKVSVYELFTE